MRIFLSASFYVAIVFALIKFLLEGTEGLQSPGIWGSRKKKQTNHPCPPDSEHLLLYLHPQLQLPWGSGGASALPKFRGSFSSPILSRGDELRPPNYCLPPLPHQLGRIRIVEKQKLQRDESQFQKLQRDESKFQKLQRK